MSIEVRSHFPCIVPESRKRKEQASRSGRWTSELIYHGSHISGEGRTNLSAGRATGFRCLVDKDPVTLMSTLDVLSPTPRPAVDGVPFGEGPCLVRDLCVLRAIPGLVPREYKLTLGPGLQLYQELGVGSLLLLTIPQFRSLPQHGVWSKLRQEPGRRAPRRSLTVRASP